MSFKKDFPEFRAFQDTNKFYYKTLPSTFWNGLQGLIRAFSDTEQQLKGNLNRIAEKIPCVPTTDWSWSILENQIDYYVEELRKKVEHNGRIDTLMDYLAEIVSNKDDRIERLNEYLDEMHVGYKCYIRCAGFTNSEISWERKEKEDVIDTLTETKEIVKSSFQQAFEEYARARETWKDANDERARKDVIRNCVNAMESIIKICANENEIKNATDKLKKDVRWGNSYFIKQGLSIFNKIHELYPDLRHGSTEMSIMVTEEAEYWVETISAVIKYMKRMADKNGIN